jgi:hypothetical protein
MSGPLGVDVLPTGSRSHVVTLPGGRVHCVEAGDGPLVLLVHGFPESWYSWRHQLPALARLDAMDAGARGVHHVGCGSAGERVVRHCVIFLPRVGQDRSALLNGVQ